MTAVLKKNLLFLTSLKQATACNGQLADVPLAQKIVMPSIVKTSFLQMSFCTCFRISALLNG